MKKVVVETFRSQGLPRYTGRRGTGPVRMDQKSKFIVEIQLLKVQGYKSRRKRGREVNVLHKYNLLIRKEGKIV